MKRFTQIQDSFLLTWGTENSRQRTWTSTADILSEVRSRPDDQDGTEQRGPYADLHDRIMRLKNRNKTRSRVQ
ncbi:hypothetical protein HAV15_011091 [Penicillium sp. str. |nr:hypothetical protein HAV15_011091 [Penicillium sp. str. \